ncbi:PREDICTED: neuropeptides capa receptor-like, partial [Papilio xuthus]|uniref:Neuropeptides capa receptor-like n=1 Tax=Papilio xuthus TaxID=66420 RepID=A0AAJ6ZLL8_PAPXU
ENLLTCAVIFYDKTMHTITNYYLLNLATSDIITTLAVLMGAADSFEYATWSCKIHYLFIIVLWNNTILTLTMLSIERFVAIWYPLQFQSTSDWRRVLKVIIVIWVMALLETIPEFWTLKSLKANKTLFCSTVPTPLARIINGVLALVTFVIPMIIMSYVYFMIAFKVNVTQKRYSNNKIFNHQDHRKKVNQLVVALALSFLLCWSPFFTMRMLIFLMEMKQLMAFVKWWLIDEKVMFVTGFFSVVLHPILFSLISTKFRESLKRLWITKIRRREINVTMV